MSVHHADLTAAATIYDIRAPLLADPARATRNSLVSARIIADVARLGDFLAAGLSGFAVAAVYVDETGVPLTAGYLAATLMTALATVLIFDLLKLYRVPELRSVIRQMPRLLLGWLGAFALLAAGLFMVKSGEEFSRGWLAMWVIIGALSILAVRTGLAGLVHRWNRTGQLYRRAVVYGTGTVTRETLAQLEADLDADVRICGLYDERGGERVPTQTLGYPVLGNLEDLIAYARSSRVDIVLIALPITAEARIAQVLKHLSQLPVEIKLPARTTRLRFSHGVYSHIGNVAMIDLMDKPISAWGAVAKWTFDKAIAALALVLLAPVLLAVAIAIRRDSKGPILFKQKRYGFNNELIEVYKFRSMYTDKCDATAAKLVTKDDPRVTPVGRFIRKTSLDELPQLINVLKGELSLVGPRPHALSAKAGNQLYDEVVEEYFARHRVKPGITGWAQINGWRGETDTPVKIQRRVEHDLYYIENWSVFLDFYILLKTPLALLKTENAY
ncbi:MAG: undecaprenyl-phosphate glucose phosphotransferase [Hyphomicrobiaceae bacterium]|nr:undecaprenyl-phosphate glucose phosphotransferase [Hyphomicrobiaceae bacterium]